MPVAMVPPNDFFGKNYGLQSHLATISCVYALSPSVSWRVSSTRALVTLRRFNLEDDPLNLSISMSFCIILHGGLAPHINTTWTTRSWWRFCQVTEDYAHTMISFKLLSSVPACSILKISIIYMISIDKYGVCVWLLYVFCSFTSSPMQPSPTPHQLTWQGPRSHWVFRSKSWCSACWSSKRKKQIPEGFKKKSHFQSV